MRLQPSCKRAWCSPASIRQLATTTRRRCAINSVRSAELLPSGIIYAVTTGVEHDWPGHSEHQGRVVSTLSGIEATGLSLEERVNRIRYEPATPDKIKLVHSAAYVDGLADVVKQHVRSRSPFELRSRQPREPSMDTSSSYSMLRVGAYCIRRGSSDVRHFGFVRDRASISGSYLGSARCCCRTVKGNGHSSFCR
jgi:hypothetical protein